MPNIKHFFTKVVGVTKTNADRKRRQTIIKKCQVGEKLLLDHEDDNPVDPNAVKVCRADGQQLGYLFARLAGDVVKRSKQGYNYAVFVKEITGGEEGESYGCNLVIVEAQPGVTDAEAQEYVDREVQPLFGGEPEALIADTRPRPRSKSGGCLVVVLCLVASIGVAAWCAS